MNKTTVKQQKADENNITSPTNKFPTKLNHNYNITYLARNTYHTRKKIDIGKIPRRIFFLEMSKLNEYVIRLQLQGSKHKRIQEFGLKVTQKQNAQAHGHIVT